MVDDLLVDADALGIPIEEQRLRLLGLCFLPSELLDNPLIQQMIVRVLNDVECDPETRLDFLEQQIEHLARPRLP